MTVGEQVVIEAALVRVADSLEARGRTGADSLMSDFVRIAARLIRLQGRQGEITATNPATGAPLEMKAVSFIGVDASSAGLPNVHLLVAWSGLDDLRGNVERALVIMTDDPAQTGTFTFGASSGTDAVRFLDFTSGGGFFFNVSGTVSVSAPAFSTGCAGLPNSSAFTCEFGRETMGGSAVVSKDNGVTQPSITIPGALLPAFRVTATTLVFP
jgi:hypothetical protein